MKEQIQKRVMRIFCLCLLTACIYAGAGARQPVSVNAQPAQKPESLSLDEIMSRTFVPETGGDDLDSMLAMYADMADDMEQESEEEEETEPEENEYARLAIADVDKYVNVRSIPSTDGEILGKMYDGAVAEILEIAGENDDWFYVTSGSVKGYIKSEYFIYGQDAADVIDDYVTRNVVVQAQRLNVREKPDIESKRIGYLDHGEKAALLENCGEWMKIKYSGDKQGYVSAEYVTVTEEFTYAKSIEEERAQREAMLALQKRQETSEQSKPENIVVQPPETVYSTNEELRSQIVEYALQFVGNPYVNGGNSLTSGTDCSGFTSLIFADFGYSLGRTPGSQYSSAGRAIDYSQIQPGDIICYSSNGGKSCTHVAIYIGDGQIVHAANARKGIIVFRADYDRIIGVRNVIG